MAARRTAGVCWCFVILAEPDLLVADAVVFEPVSAVYHAGLNLHLWQPVCPLVALTGHGAYCPACCSLRKTKLFWRPYQDARTTGVWDGTHFISLFRNASATRAVR